MNNDIWTISETELENEDNEHEMVYNKSKDDTHTKKYCYANYYFRAMQSIKHKMKDDERAKSISFLWLSFQNIMQTMDRFIAWGKKWLYNKTGEPRSLKENSITVKATWISEMSKETTKQITVINTQLYFF